MGSTRKGTQDTSTYIIDPQRPPRTFSGADIRCVVHTINNNGQTSPLVVANLQTISYSIHREKFPVREIGHTRAVGYTRGSRTIGGTMIFTMLDREVLWPLLQLNPLDATWNGPGYQYSNYAPMLDQLPPFDVSIVFQNEYGDISSMAIYGVEIVDEGMSMSIDDILTEKTCSYVALDIDVVSPYTTGNKYSIFAESGPGKRQVTSNDYNNFIKTLRERREQLFSGDNVYGYDIPYDSAIFNSSIATDNVFSPGAKARYDHDGETWIVEVGRYDTNNMMYMVQPADIHPVSSVDSQYAVLNDDFSNIEIQNLNTRYYMKKVPTEVPAFKLSGVAMVEDE